MICWYCYWGWAKAVRDIYDKYVATAGESAMEYGPAHIVWADENFELDNVEYCLKACDDKTAHWKDLPQWAIDEVKRSLVELAALPKEIRELEPENYGEDINDDPQNFPPPAGTVMSLGNGRGYVADGTVGQRWRL